MHAPLLICMHACTIHIIAVYTVFLPAFGLSILKVVNECMHAPLLFRMHACTVHDSIIWYIYCLVYIYCVLNVYICETSLLSIELSSSRRAGTARAGSASLFKCRASLPNPSTARSRVCWYDFRSKSHHLHTYPTALSANGRTVTTMISIRCCTRSPRMGPNFQTRKKQAKRKQSNRASHSHSYCPRHSLRTRLRQRPPP